METLTDLNGSLEDFLNKSNEKLGKELIKRCELLSNPDFLKKYKRITEVAEEIHLASVIHYRTAGRFNYFHRVGVNNINDFLRKLNNGDWEARVIYEEVLETIWR